ncbi:MAG: hypothetical protein Q8L52_03540 [bacterium]|nr:hypothetical protein [bacterium]
MALISANQAIRWVQRIGILALGLTANKAMVYWYDFTVYPSLIANYGLIHGWLYAAVGSVGLCLGTLWFYNLTKQDWLLLETLKHVRDGQAMGRIRRFFHNLANRGDAFAFFFLCVWHDAFIATVYMRKGAGNYTMTTRDWKIFWASTLVSEIWWGLVVFGVIESFRNWLAPFAPDWLYLAINTVEAFNRWLASFVPPLILNWLGFS